LYELLSDILKSCALVILWLNLEITLTSTSVFYYFISSYFSHKDNLDLIFCLESFFIFGKEYMLGSQCINAK